MTYDLALTQSAQMVTSDTLASHFPILHRFAPEKQVEITRAFVQQALSTPIPIYVYKMKQGSVQDDSEGTLYRGNKSTPDHSISIATLKKENHLLYINAVQSAFIRAGWQEAKPFDANNAKPLTHFVKPMAANNFMGGEATSWDWVPELDDQENQTLNLWSANAPYDTTIAQKLSKAIEKSTTVYILVAPKQDSPSVDMYIMGLKLTVAAQMSEVVKAAHEPLIGTRKTQPFKLDKQSFLNSITHLYNSTPSLETEKPLVSISSGEGFGKAGSLVTVNGLFIPKTAQMASDSYSVYAKLVPETMGENDALMVLPFQVMAMVQAKALMVRIELELNDSIVRESKSVKSRGAKTGELVVPKGTAFAFAPLQVGPPPVTFPEPLTITVPAPLPVAVAPQPVYVPAPVAPQPVYVPAPVAPQPVYVPAPVPMAPPLLLAPPMMTAPQPVYAPPQLVAPLPLAPPVPVVLPVPVAPPLVAPVAQPVVYPPSLQHFSPPTEQKQPSGLIVEDF